VLYVALMAVLTVVLYRLVVQGWMEGALCGGAAVYLCCASLIQNATARGILRTILGLRLSVVGLLVALAFIGAGLRPVTFAAVMLAVLVALVAFEISRNLRPEAHPRNKPSAE
jgi:hypothetical protein